jgi:hypothetical protein
MITPHAAERNHDALDRTDLEEELRLAEKDFQRGDFIELTVEELDRCIAAGEWPWPKP